MSAGGAGFGIETNLEGGAARLEKIPRSTLTAQDTSPEPVTPLFPVNPGDPNSPTPLIPQGCPNPDPELGCLQLGPPELQPGSKLPVMYLIPRIDFFSSSNILSGRDPVQDGLMRPSLSLLIAPQLGPKTFFIASIEGALNRYFDQTQFNYDELRLRAGISQQLSPTMSGEIGWSNQQLFIASDDIFGFPRGTRFLNDQSIRLEISRRDQLAKKLYLSSFYQFRASFANPGDRSRLINVAFLSLNYEVSPNLQLALDYQFASANFTQQSRTDLYHQGLARITYNAFRSAQLSLYGGFSTGTSTDPTIRFNGYLLGVSVSVNLVLF
jgi:hypothetical protein